MDLIKKSQSYLYPKHSRRIKKQGIKDENDGKLGDDSEVFAKFQVGPYTFHFLIFQSLWFYFLF